LIVNFLYHLPNFPLLVTIQKMADNTNTTAAATAIEEKPAVSLKEMKKFEKWTKSLQYITGLGLTEEEKTDFKKRLDVDLEEYQCNQCETWKDNLMKNSKVLLVKLRSMGSFQSNMITPPIF
jgi:hypothetical protein